MVPSHIFHNILLEAKKSVIKLVIKYDSAKLSSITNSLASNVLLVFQILLKFIPDSVYTDKSVVNT